MPHGRASRIPKFYWKHTTRDSKSHNAFCMQITENSLAQILQVRKIKKIQCLVCHNLHRKKSSTLRIFGFTLLEWSTNPRKQKFTIVTELRLLNNEDSQNLILRLGGKGASKKFQAGNKRGFERKDHWTCLIG